MHGPRKRAMIRESNRRRKRAIEVGWKIDIIIPLVILAVGFIWGPMILGLLFGLPMLFFGIKDYGKYPEPGPGQKALWERQRRRWDEIDRRFGRPPTGYRSDEHE